MKRSWGCAAWVVVFIGAIIVSGVLPSLRGIAPAVVVLAGLVVVFAKRAHRYTARTAVTGKVAWNVWLPFWIGLGAVLLVFGNLLLQRPDSVTGARNSSVDAPTAILATLPFLTYVVGTGLGWAIAKNPGEQRQAAEEADSPEDTGR